MGGNVSNFVFDLGGVLINYKPREYVKKLVSFDKVDILTKIVFESLEWIELDRGIITEEEAIEKWCARNPNYTKEIKLITKNWKGMLTPKYENIKLLEPLKHKGYKLYILSNFHKKAFNYVFKKYDFFKMFDGMVISFKVNMVKPEPQIYRFLIEKYNLKPSCSVFIDDSEENIKAAKEEGLKAFLVTGDEEFQKFIKSFLGGVSVEA